jgi:hypothetical protein
LELLNIEFWDRDFRSGAVVEAWRMLSPTFGCQKPANHADQVCERTEKFGRGYGFLAIQLNRAALSISANIAEGNGRFTKAALT